MTRPYDRSCHNGACTSTGMAEPGFCKCKADAERMEMLERALAPFVKFYEGMRELGAPYPQSGPAYSIVVGGKDLRRLDLTVEDFKAARAALDYRPAQIKGREG